MKLSSGDKEILKELCLQHNVSYEKVVRLLDIVQEYEFKERRTGIYDALRDVLKDPQNEGVASL